MDHRETEAEWGGKQARRGLQVSEWTCTPLSVRPVPGPPSGTMFPQLLMLHGVRSPPSGSGHISLKPRARLRWRYPALLGLSHLLSGHPLGPPAPGRALHPLAHPTSPLQGVLGSQLTNISTKGARLSALAWLPRLTPRPAWQLVSLGHTQAPFLCREPPFTPPVFTCAAPAWKAGLHPLQD